MCGGGGKVDTSQSDYLRDESMRARAEEQARQDRIRLGTDKINEIFKQFDDTFYRGRRDAFMGALQPQLDDRYNEARKQLTYALARAGTLNSSIAGDQQGKLSQAYDNERAGILSQATEDETNARNQTAQTKATLVSQLNATGDADAAANDATQASRTLYTAQPRISPLGDIFAGISDGIGAFQTGRTNARIRDLLSAGASRGSAARTVAG